MSKKYYPTLTLDYEYLSQESCPEQICLLEVLKQALKDLDEPVSSVRQETLEWFSEWRNTMPDLISYKDIIDNVDLEPGHIKFIEEKVTLRRNSTGTPVRVPMTLRYVVR